MERASIIELYGVGGRSKSSSSRSSRRSSWRLSGHQRQCGAVAGVDALLVYLLLRYLAFLSEWSHSFSRLFTLMRVAWWKNGWVELASPLWDSHVTFVYLARPEKPICRVWDESLWDSHRHFDKNS